MALQTKLNEIYGNVNDNDHYLNVGSTILIL